MIALSTLLFTQAILAEEQTLFACKKRIPLTQSAYQWALIIENEAGDLKFEYGNGIETQILQITYIREVIETQSEHYENSNELKVWIDRTRTTPELKFIASNSKKTIRSQGYFCE